MNKSLDQLIQISKFDTEISSFGPKIDAQNEKLTMFKAEAVKLQKEVELRETAITEANSKKTKNNIHLDELKSKLEDIAKKSDIVSTAKEVKALQLEEEIAREQISFTNEELVRLDNVIELNESELVGLRAELAEEETAVKELETNIEKELAQLNEQRGEIAEKRDGIISKVDVKVLSFYQKIKRWAGDTAVVPVKKQACYGCFMKISDRTQAQVAQSEEIVTCPHCGRIIYKANEEETAEA